MQMLLLLLLSCFSHVRLCATPDSSPPGYSILGFSMQPTGVGCHFLLQCMTVKSESEVTQWCPTLSYPMDCSLSVSSIHGIFQARVLEWVAVAFSTTLLKLLIFLLAILIPACDSSSLAFHLMSSAHKLSKQGDNIQP